ncbi:YqkE family protein [Paenibacillus sediminis]|uniref:Proteasome assembly chaperone (PAC2) family protein n=1 Tax=Paenibacillus sediminis TaxID=664909 RepID=A0ABS4H1E7_9BACL|nr:proteasome assembly chaperone (PAC2) family protein [Paenibacillus sediminis]
MAKKKKTIPAPNHANQDKPATLKDLLNAEVLNKLKAQADQLKEIEEKQKEVARKQAEEERKAEQKQRENDFEYLLNNSSLDWEKYK